MKYESNYMVNEPRAHIPPATHSTHDDHSMNTIMVHMSCMQTRHWELSAINPEAAQLWHDSADGVVSKLVKVLRESEHDRHIPYMAGIRTMRMTAQHVQHAVRTSARA
jgi:hypothetical protein